MKHVILTDTIKTKDFVRHLAMRAKKWTYVRRIVKEGLDEMEYWHRVNNDNYRSVAQLIEGVDNGTYPYYNKQKLNF